MSDEFIDSNILVYLFDETDARKYGIARELTGEAIESGSAVISFQVVQEVLNLLTTRFASPAAQDRAQDALRDILMPLWRIMPTEELYERALRVRGRYGFDFYDSLIVAAAIEAGCSRLLTEDLQNGQRIEGLIVVNPFAEARS